MKAKHILVVDDDEGISSQIYDKLKDRGLNAFIANSVAAATGILKRHSDKIRVALLDIWLARGRDQRSARSHGGRIAGWQLARFIRTEYPHIRIIGMSLHTNEDVRDWFAEYGHGYLRKTWLVHGASSDFVDVIEHAAQKPHRKRKPRCFVVHGRDSESLHELLHYLRGTLKMPQPTILRELPSRGRTIIEKFEDAAYTTDIVFALLTPDDIVTPAGAADQSKRRARQNVIFELGYFYAKLQRTGGRVILLHKGEIELPSDIAGIIYVDISNGVEAAGETIRRELSSWL